MHGLNVILGFVVICILQSFAFAESNSPFYNSHIGWTYNYIIVLILLYIYVFNNKYVKISNVAILLSLCFSIEWVLEYFHSYGNMSVFSMLYQLVLISFCIFNEQIQAYVYKSFYWIMVLMSIAGIIAFTLYLSNIGPFSMEDFYDPSVVGVHYYANYILSYLFVPSIGFVRICGLFNEPGLFGTLGAMILIVERMKITKCNSLIFIACLLSFSMAFYVLIFFYLLFTIVVKRNIKLLVYVFILIGILIYCIFNYLDADNFDFFLNRFVYDDGHFAGDLRASNELDMYWEKVSKSVEYSIFGLGEYLPPTGSSSYKILIIRHGYFGVSLILLPLLYSMLLLSKKDRDIAILCVLFIMSIYQRPQIFNIVYFVILIGGIRHIKQNKANKKNNLYENKQIS